MRGTAREAKLKMRCSIERPSERGAAARGAAKCNEFRGTARGGAFRGKWRSKRGREAQQ